MQKKDRFLLNTLYLVKIILYVNRLDIIHLNSFFYFKIFPISTDQFLYYLAAYIYDLGMGWLKPDIANNPNHNIFIFYIIIIFVYIYTIKFLPA